MSPIDQLNTSCIPYSNNRNNIKADSGRNAAISIDSKWADEVASTAASFGPSSSILIVSLSA